MSASISTFLFIFSICSGIRPEPILASISAISRSFFFNAFNRFPGSTSARQLLASVPRPTLNWPIFFSNVISSFEVDSSSDIFLSFFAFGLAVVFKRAAVDAACLCGGKPGMPREEEGGKPGMVFVVVVYVVEYVTLVGLPT
eukprot:CAMPEP_0173170986 /NCGR_PEP_ID=MMETSP1141-20130122/1517_1 /TAXON_ID=483371 /ORGANISM="non described non described, Strain CCMP2298" /LENGTH=141 /DNA_ID=CAMNT_0014092891 /DNA_START=644 /DNA_END=1069 /DNA_ORIENTATION=+